MDTSAPPATRSDRKRLAIVDAATRLFLSQGYQGTSMGEIAAAAEVSKQTVYKQFQDKEQLFTGIVTGITERAQDIVQAIDASFDQVEDLEHDLIGIARSYAKGVLSPHVIQLRRLVISEADNFPDLATAYFARAPQQGLDAVARGLASLAERALLGIDDAEMAAVHFAYLVLGPLIDQALFHPTSPAGDEQIERFTVSGVRAFLAAYR
jgi:TetR/AcrR family transcriptional repressor of mexJK operon